MEKNSNAKADIVGETYKEIVNTPISQKDLRDSSNDVFIHMLEKLKFPKRTNCIKKMTIIIFPIIKTATILT
jgi:hypothetical protein